ncbi:MULTISPECIES: DegT/DnrJ/EryC1/StrS aminotransferase family protein [Allobacillus]|uniref:DegT/DnrJ/EryC1/StrS family aminotransferase n=1 Tax=Allobacillus salarius TaxID=1955272 RepID=A0A556PMS1_9BACI|nr:DegT/DnrJ/EryC1/StrS family aminotransferase [Allobacillus salarius]TSJ65648.1 DegT/DnrJ/EryC1/StrS family aminotransferase [Allobacillus salarius]
MPEKFENPIPVNKPLIPEINGSLKRIEEIFNTKWLTNNGEQHQELETGLKDYLNIDYLSLVNNGTMALLLGIKSLDLNGEVITTPFTFPATTQALDWNNLQPVFCDIDPITLNIDVNKIESLITEETSAILGVHVFGNPCDVERIQKIADKYNLKVIYDGAHAFGTIYNGKPISTYGDMTMFSFHATKLFNTIEGGAVAVNDSLLEKKIDQLKNFGMINKEEVGMSGLNAKLNEVQAGIGIEVLKIIQYERIKRKKIKETYEKYLKNIPGVRVITTLENEENSYQYFVVKINELEFGMSRDLVYEKLKEYNVYTRKYFNPLCSDFPWYQNLDSAKSINLPTAHRIVNEVLTLPFYGELELEAIKKICKIIEYIHKNAKKEKSN